MGCTGAVPEELERLNTVLSAMGRPERGPRMDLTERLFVGLAVASAMVLVAGFAAFWVAGG